jgi:hypothetical protein
VFDGMKFDWITDDGTWRLEALKNDGKDLRFTKYMLDCICAKFNANPPACIGKRLA